MSRVKTYKYFINFLFIILVTLCGCGSNKSVSNPEVSSSSATQNDSIQVADTVAEIPETPVNKYVITSDTITNLSETPVNEHNIVADTLNELDTIPLDTISNNKIINNTDSIAQKQKKSMIDNQIDRSANDSTIQDFKNNKVYYYGDAKVKYGDITIEADYIEFDFVKHTVYATGVRDSLGRLTGTPVFTEGDKKYEAEAMTFNFDTKKGVINKVFTEDAMGYLHGEKIKKMDDDKINMHSGSFTTCSLKDHPHYEFHFQKAIVIPDDKIVTKFAYFKLEETPLPIGVPFALFPNSSGQRSGVIIPSYGESANRGFYFENGGYYWAINQNMDLQLVGDIYTRGSWALKPTFRYIKRYRYNGSFTGSYAINKVGAEGSSDFTESSDFKIRWIHKQDRKARPKSSFSADVYIVSSNYNKYNAISSTEYLSNTFQSSVAYQTSFNDLFYLTVNGSHSQNTLTKIMTVTLPEITLTMNRLYPLKNIGKTGKKHWYSDLNISYTTNAKNYISMADSLFFKDNWTDAMQNGIQHRIPVNLPIKLFKYFTWTTSSNLLDRMYFDYLDKQWYNDTIIVNGNPVAGYLQSDTVHKFRNVFTFDLSSTLTTTIYGQVNFKKGPIRAIRHVLTPSFGISYNPDFSKPFWNYYDTYIDGYGIEQLYSMFAGNIYGAPSKAESGRLTYSFSNNLEIKVPSKKDTITGLKKIKLIENLSLSGSYDLAKDSLNWSYLSLSGRTSLLKNLSVRYSSIWDPYALDSLGKQTNRFEWDVNRRLFRKNSVSWNFSLSYTMNNDTFKKKDDKSKEKKKFDDSPYASEQEMLDINNNPDDYVDWATAWSLSLSYNLTLSNTLSYINFIMNDNRKVIQTLSVKGDVKLSPKWKVSAQTGWDFEAKKLSYTSFTVYRDLHCWEMRFNWIPMGAYKSWNFAINVKASALQDLKLTKKKDYRDN